MAERLTLWPWKSTERRVNSREPSNSRSSPVPANIAEGFGRHTTKYFLHFLTIANGSLEETRYFLIGRGAWQYLGDDRLARLEGRCDSVGRNIGFSRGAGRRSRAAH